MSADDTYGPLLSLPRAARLCGFLGHPEAAGRRLFRYLMALEARDGARLLVCSGRGNGRRYRVTLAGLREACPDLLTRRDEIVEVVRAEVGKLAERIEEVADRQDLLVEVHTARLDEHQRRIARLESPEVAMSRHVRP